MDNLGRARLPMPRGQSAFGPGGQTNVPFFLSNVVAIAGGVYHSLALTKSGTLSSWGRWTCLPAASNVLAIAAGYDYNLALLSNGIAFECGSGFSRVVGGLSNAVAIAAGGDPSFANHSLALRSNGTVFAWGDNTFGQSTVPAGLSNVIAIAAGRSHSVALKSDGTIISWGASGQTNLPRSLTDIVAVAAGGG